MFNPQQNKIQNEIKQIKKEINLLEDKLKKNEKRQSISKWTKACRKNTNQKIQNILKRIVKTHNFFQTKKNTKYITEYIAK